jgi:plastocyanin
VTTKVYYEFAIVSFTISILIGLSTYYNAFAQFDATEVYNSKLMTLPANIKHLIILLPNEAHESQNPGDVSSEQRLINEPYIPLRATVNPGTMVIWFNADVDHDHKITLTNGATPTNIIFESGTFTFNDASKPVILNDTGTFNYYEDNVNEDDPDFVMIGTITVVAQQSPKTNSADNASGATSTHSTGVLGRADTAGVLMIPSTDIDTYIQELKSSGFTVASTHNFNDIRAGDPQALLVWTTSGTSLGKVISTLQEITQNLPYS